MREHLKAAINALTQHERQFAPQPFASDVGPKHAPPIRPDREIAAIMTICDQMERLVAREDVKEIEFEELWQRLIELKAGTASVALKREVSDGFVKESRARKP
jgi:hypothetical protein